MLSLKSSAVYLVSSLIFSRTIRSSSERLEARKTLITTAGTDRHSIAYELHSKAVDILDGRRVNPTFYPVVYGLKDDEDWEDEANWYKVNPSLGYTVDIERLRDAYREAKQNPADEVTFKWLRLNMWVSSTVAWIPDAIFMKGNEEIDLAALEGRDCYGGLDLSSTGDITALVLVFPPRMRMRSIFCFRSSGYRKRQYHKG